MKIKIFFVTWVFYFLFTSSKQKSSRNQDTGNFIYDLIILVANQLSPLLSEGENLSEGE